MTTKSDSGLDAFVIKSILGTIGKTCVGSVN